MIDIECPVCNFPGPHRVTDDDDPHVIVVCDMCWSWFTARIDGETDD